MHPHKKPRWDTRRMNKVIRTRGTRSAALASVPEKTSMSSWISYIRNSLHETLEQMAADQCVDTYQKWETWLEPWKEIVEQTATMIFQQHLTSLEILKHKPSDYWRTQLTHFAALRNHHVLVHQPDEVQSFQKQEEDSLPPPLEPLTQETKSHVLDLPNNPGVPLLPKQYARKDPSKGIYVVFEGQDGSGKSTQVALLKDFCDRHSIDCLATAEPGSIHSPLTLELRRLILDNAVMGMTSLAREYLFQAARSSVLDTVVGPALAARKLVISDRGILSGLAYSKAAGFDEDTSLDLLELTSQDFCKNSNRLGAHIYDLILLLDGNSRNSFLRAAEKKEFAQGDAIESRGADYMLRVRNCMQQMVSQEDKFPLKCPVVHIQVDGKSREDVHACIVQALVAHGILCTQL